MATILYSSTDIRKHICQLFSKSKKKRIAISAFVGEGAEAYLPEPMGIEIICWPKAGGTNPNTIRKLIKSGANVSFSDNLHMKLYWAEDSGAVMTSANLSTNALGSGDLKEIGILLESKQIDIAKIKKSLNIYEVSENKLKELDILHDEHCKKNRFHIYNLNNYVDWYEESKKGRKSWKLGWWDAKSNEAQESIDRALSLYNRSEIFDYINGKRSDYINSDWVLCFKITPAGVDLRTVSWLYVDFVVKVPPEDRNAFDREYPYQAVQVFNKKVYPPPPFRIDEIFKKSFKEVTRKIGYEKITTLNSVVPNIEMIDKIYKAHAKG